MDEKKAPAEAGMLEKLKGALSGEGKKGLKNWKNWILAAGLIGIALIGLSGLLPEKDKTAVSAASAQASGQSAEEFVSKTEEKLAAIVRSIEGAGECRVMVTLENGVEYVYATEERINTDRQEDENTVSQRDDSDKSVIVVDTENGKQGLLVTEIQPTVKGVVVVCEGGDQPIVQQRIIDTITTALNLSSKRVCVTKLSQ
ncbi:MAG TPA: stage III sporulation protein AG [Firmicutes bacterium]|nr:stage III sporulation protein AG [Bacillota bacterium]